VEDPTLEPDTVWLEGPKEFINNLPPSLPLALPQSNIRKDFTEEVELNLAQSELITAQPQKFNVALNVEKFEQINGRVKLTIINIPSRLKQGSVVKEIACTYRLPVSITKQFKGDSLLAIIDLKNRSAGEHKLAPQIIGLPAHAVVLKTDTVLINF
jgi:hypothetical protein